MSKQYYEFAQNNSGGAIKGPALFLYIEADSAEEANEIALSRGVYFDRDDDECGVDCECCMSRWYKADEDSLTSDTSGNWLLELLHSDKDIPHILIVDKETSE